MLKYFIGLGKVNAKGLTDLKLMTNVAKNFARREISKGNIVAQSIITNQNENFKLNTTSQNGHLNGNDNISSQNKMKVLSLEESKKFIKNNIIEIAGNKVNSSFFKSITQVIKTEGLLNNQKFLDSLQEISLNYSNNENFEKSTVFKFLILIDQILTKRSLEFYDKDNLTQSAFSHLIQHFGAENFKLIFSKDLSGDYLLNYNFLYFMSINRGEFSSTLQIVFDHLKNKEEFSFRINKLLKTKALRLSHQVSLEKIFSEGKNLFNFVDKNIETPSSDLISDYTFKYNEVHTKQRLLNENVENKKTYEKLKWVLNTLKGLENNGVSFDKKLLKNLEIILATNFVENSENIFGGEYGMIKEEINTFDKYLQNKVKSLSKLNENTISRKVTFDNLYDVYNPLFSGEVRLEVQFSKVAQVFDNLFALQLLRKYVEVNTEREEGNNTFLSFVDLYKLNKIITPVEYDSFETVLKNVDLIHYDFETFNKVEVNLNFRKVSVANNPLNAEINVKKEEKKDTKVNVMSTNTQTNASTKKSENVKAETAKILNEKQSSVKEEKKSFSPITVEKKADKKPDENPVSSTKSTTTTDTHTTTKQDESVEVPKAEAKVKTQKKETIKNDVKVDKSSHVKINDFIKDIVKDIKAENPTKIDSPIVKEEIKEQKVAETPEIETPEPTTASIVKEEIKSEKVVESTKIETPEPTFASPIVKEEIKLEKVAETPKIEIPEPTPTQETKLASIKDENVENIAKKHTATPTQATQAIKEEQKQENVDQVKTQEQVDQNKHQDFKPINNANIKIKPQSFSSGFYKNTRKGFCESSNKINSSSNNQTKSNPPKFIVPPKGDLDKSDKDQKIQGTSGSKFPKMVVPPKENKDNSSSVKSTENSSVKFDKIKFVVPPKTTQNTTKSDMQYQPKKKVSSEGIFEPIFPKKSRDSGSTYNSTQNEGDSIIAKIDYLTLRLKDLSENLHHTYSESNLESIDITKAKEKFNKEYFLNKISLEDFDVEEASAEKLEKHVHEKLVKIFRKYSNNREKTLQLIFSLTNPELREESLVDLEYSFYQIFNNEEYQGIFNKINLGFIGYQSLLNSCLLDISMQNRNNFENIINHIESTFYLPNNDNIMTIMEICDKFYYPTYLKVIIDNYVINKNIKLSPENYTKYIQIMSNFPEMNEYVSNLIQGSNTDFLVPIKAEFYEQIILNNLYKGKLDGVKSNIKYLNDRYLIDYKEVQDRNEETIKGNKFLLNLIHEFFEDKSKGLGKMNKKTTQESRFANDVSQDHQIVEICHEIIENIKTIDKNWSSDVQFLKSCAKIYSENFEGYNNNYLDSLVKLQEKRKAGKNHFMKMVEIVQTIGGSLRYTSETKNKLIGVLSQFLSLVENGDIELSYEEKFHITREENINKLYKFFQGIKIEGGSVSDEQFKTLKSLIEAVVDPVTFDRFNKRDKLFIESVIFKTSKGAKREALDLLQKIDVRRYYRREASESSKDQESFEDVGPVRDLEEPEIEPLADEAQENENRMI